MGYLKAYFDGKEIPVRILKVNRNLTPNISNKMQEIESVSGAEFVYSKYKEKSITIEYVINNRMARQLSEFRRNTAGIIYSVEPKKLIFSDEPDLYYDAVLDGEAKLDEEYLQSTGTLTFLVPDGLAHSTVEKVFPASPNADGILEAVIVNEGTEAVPVSYEIVHNHENGYIGIVSEYGVMQYGRVEEADGEVYKQNEILASGFAGYADDHGTNHQAPSSTTQGILKMIPAAGGQWLGLGGGQASGAGHWNGGMKTITLPADSEGNHGAKNFYCYTRHWFESGAMGQTGAQTIAFLTDDNRVICCMSISKGDTVGNTAHVDWAAGGRHLKSVVFTSADNADNPYSQRLWNGDNDFRKEGERITIYWDGIYYNFIVPEIRDMECAKIQLWIGQWGARNLSGQYMMRNYIGSVDFSKMNVEKWKDVPNRYPTSSKVSIDGESRKVYVNGMANAGDEMVGTKYFHVPPGETKVQFYYSSFSNPPPAVTAKIREAYL